MKRTLRAIGGADNLCTKTRLSQLGVVMCTKCLNAVMELYPDCPYEVMGDFLFSATCFPFGHGDKVRNQLLEAANNGATSWQMAIAYADRELNRIWNQERHKYVDEENP